MAEHPRGWRPTGNTTRRSTHNMDGECRVGCTAEDTKQGRFKRDIEKAAPNQGSRELTIAGARIQRGTVINDFGPATTTASVRIN